MIIRELTAVDAEKYNAFFAEGARRHPETLRITPVDVARAPFSTAPLADAVTLAAVGDGGEWLGVGSVERERGRDKRAHVAWIMRMYAAVPGRGAGRAILRALVERARAMPGIAKLNLTVVAGNEAAIKLYASEGFVEFAREADALRHDGRSLAELSMTRPIVQ